MISQLQSAGYVEFLNAALNAQATAHLQLGQIQAAADSIQKNLDNLHPFQTAAEAIKIKHQIGLKLKHSLRLLAVAATRQNNIESALDQIQLSTQALNFKSKSNQSDNLQTLSDKTFALENPKLSKQDGDKLQAEITQLNAAIEFASQTQDNPKARIDLAQVQANLPADSMLVQFHISPIGGVSWWIGTGQTSSHEVMGLDTLKALIEASRAEFEGRIRGSQNSQKLARELFAPLQNYKHIKTLYLVLDEPMNLIPINALPHPAHSDGTTLI